MLVWLIEGLNMLLLRCLSDSVQCGGWLCPPMSVTFRNQHQHFMQRLASCAESKQGFSFQIFHPIISLSLCLRGKIVQRCALLSPYLNNYPVSLMPMTPGISPHLRVCLSGTYLPSDVSQTFSFRTYQRLYRALVFRHQSS